MLDYARQRASQVLMNTRTVIFASAGPAGVLAGEFPCEVVNLRLYLLLPRTSDHLFNLEQDDRVTLLSASWEMNGTARVISQEALPGSLSLLQDNSVPWSVLICVEPNIVQLRKEKGWGHAETIHLST